MVDKTDIEAGMKTVEYYVERGFYGNLICMSKDTDLPESVRKAAAAAAEASVMKRVESYVDSGQYDALIKMSEDKNLHGSVREVAGMKVIEEYAKNGWYGSLSKMSKKQDLPESVRKAAEELATKRIANPIAGDGVLSQGKVKPPAADAAKAQTEPAKRKLDA